MKGNGITPKEIERLRESLWGAYEFFGSWRPVGEQVLGMSGAYAWKVARGILEPNERVIFYWREFWLGRRHPWATNPKLMRAAWKEIEDRWGPDEAISAPQLAKRLKVGIRKARASVRGLRRQGYPICTTLSRSRSGYFRPRSLEEYRAWRKRTQLNRAYDLIETEGAQKKNEARWFPSEEDHEKEQSHNAMQLSLGGL